MTFQTLCFSALPMRSFLLLGIFAVAAVAPAEESFASLSNDELTALVEKFPDVSPALQTELALRALDRGDHEAAHAISAATYARLGLPGVRLHAEVLLAMGDSEQADALMSAASERYQLFWPEELLVYRLLHGHGDVTELIEKMVQAADGISRNPHQRGAAGWLYLLAGERDKAIEVLSTRAPGVRQTYHFSAAFAAALEAQSAGLKEQRDAILGAYLSTSQQNLRSQGDWEQRSFQEAMFTLANASQRAWRRDRPALPPGPPLREAVGKGMGAKETALLNLYAGRAYEIAGEEWYAHAIRAYQRAVEVLPSHRNTLLESALAAHFRRHLLARVDQQSASPSDGEDQP